MERLVLYGSCQAQQLRRIFAASAAVRSRFDVRLQWTGDQALKGCTWVNDVAEADVLMVQETPELPAFEPGYWARARGRIISYPVLTLSALWPFDTAHGEADPAVTEAQARGEGLMFNFHDRLLAKLRHAVPDKEARFIAYRSLDRAVSEEIDRLIQSIDPPARLRFHLAFLRRDDAKHGLSVGAAVASLYRAMPVFHSVSHPAPVIMHRLAGELLAKVGVSLEPDVAAEDGFAPLQVPVHPIVAHALGLNWALERLFWNVHGHQLTFEQYYRLYIDVFG